MLTQFEVSGFKNFDFDAPYVLKLDSANGYTFNPECVEDGIIKKAMIYGANGVGKSNLGLAIFDLISHVTDKHPSKNLYNHYLHANNMEGEAHFSYHFKFESGNVEYSYTKKNLESLVSEKLTINDQEFASIDRNISAVASYRIEGAEHLATDLSASAISLVAYIRKNTVLADNEINHCFLDFLSFVDRMLFFRSLEGNNYIGLEQGSSSIESDIVKHDNVEHFQYFLKKIGINYALKVFKRDEGYQIYVDFDGVYKPFFEIASQGTRALAVFYFLLQRLQTEESVSFLFLDEFDAFYQHD